MPVKMGQPKEDLSLKQHYIDITVHLLTRFEGNIRFVGPESKTVA